MRSDNGMEFNKTNVVEFPYTPQKIGIVERKNRTLIEGARTMLDE
jgi:hypothetical protein